MADSGSDEKRGDRCHTGPPRKQRARPGTSRQPPDVCDDRDYEGFAGRLYVEEPKPEPVVDEQQKEWMLRISDATEWIT